MFVDKTIIQLNHLYRILLPNTLTYTTTEF